MPTTHDSLTFTNAPLGAGEAQVTLGGREFTTLFDAAANDVRCVVPDTGTVVLELDSAHIDREVLEGRVYLLLILQSDAEGASAARMRFAADGHSVDTQERTLVAGRYSARLERMRGGAGLPRSEGAWPVADIEVRAGERTTHVVP
jgi:hypothetical protein